MVIIKPEGGVFHSDLDAADTTPISEITHPQVLSSLHHVPVRVSQVSHSMSARRWWCYRSVTLGVRQAVVELQKCHFQCQTGSCSVTEVSLSVSARQWWCYRSVTHSAWQAEVVLCKCHTQCQTGSGGVTEVSHSSVSQAVVVLQKCHTRVSARQWWCYRSVTLSVS
jgi:hypothetical protein